MLSVTLMFSFSSYYVHTHTHTQTSIYLPQISLIYLRRSSSEIKQNLKEALSIFNFIVKFIVSRSIFIDNILISSRSANDYIS